MTPPNETKERLLDAAEELFATRGYEATSLRALTGAAGANLAAAHYHFGGKRELFQAVFARRVHDLNAERLRRLDALEAAPEPPTVEALLAAFLAPAVRRAADRDEGWARFMHLVARLGSEGGEHVEAVIEVFRNVQLRFVQAFQRALPHLGRRELLWRIHFLLGSMCNVLSDPARLHAFSGGLCSTDDADEVLAELSAFLAPGLRAPSARAATPDDAPRLAPEVRR